MVHDKPSDERREYLRNYQREWMAKRRKQWLDGNGPCVQCGSSENLQVDHIDPSTKVHHNVWSWTLVRREAELAKCQVLCRECHWVKTAEEARQRNIRQGVTGRWRHGSEYAYRKLGCRCDECRNGRAQRRAQLSRGIAAA